MSYINDYNSFWNSFWAGLYSGAISSMIVGLLVGLILWIIQAAKEKSATKVHLESEYYSVRQKIWYALKLPEVKKLYMESKFFLPIYLSECSKIVNEIPVKHWQDYLKKSEQETFLDSIELFQNAYNQFEIASVNLDTVVTMELKAISNPSTNFDDEYKYFLGKINQISQEQLSSWLDITDKNKSDEIYNDLSKKQIIEKGIKEYLFTQNKLKLILDIIDSDIAKSEYKKI